VDSRIVLRKYVRRFSGVTDRSFTRLPSPRQQTRRSGRQWLGI